MNNKIGLALSGGGYRAAAFHLGVFRKLHQLGILNNIDVISTISGGSIAGAYYGLNLSDFESFNQNFENALQKSVIMKMLCSKRIVITFSVLLTVFSLLTFYSFYTGNYLIIICAFLLFIIISMFFQFILFPFSKLKEKAYKEIFFHDKKLSDFPDKPIIAINSTNLETGTLFTFSKKKVSDSSYEFPKDGLRKISFKPETFNISFAVACSTSVPVPFNPFKLKKENFQNIDDFKRVSPSLSDGGLYDNQGIHKLTQNNSSYECNLIICSDGSQPFEFKYKGSNSFSVLYRATDIMMRKIKSLQFIRDVYSKEKSIAYFSIDWEYDKCIEYFIRAIKENKIQQEVLDVHDFSRSHIDEIINNNFTEALEHIKQRINYKKIIERGVSDKERIIVSKIKTNLTALTKKEIELLSNHASVLVELQLNLYCPTFITR